jgi:hypothetical protein
MQPPEDVHPLHAAAAPPLHPAVKAKPMSVANAVRFIHKVRTDESLRDGVVLKEYEARKAFLEERGYIFGQKEFEDGVVQALSECQLPSEAEEVQEIRNWFFVLHYL